MRTATGRDGFRGPLAGGATGPENIAFGPGYEDDPQRSSEGAPGLLSSDDIGSFVRP